MPSILLFIISTILCLLVIYVFLRQQRLKVIRPTAEPPSPHKKIVLITGASRGIGYSLLEQYAKDPDTDLIIATSSYLGPIQELVDNLGDDASSPRIECVYIDTERSNSELAADIRSLDEIFGPISHFYEVSGMTESKDPTRGSIFAREDLLQFHIPTGMAGCVSQMCKLMKARGYGKIYASLGSDAELYISADMNRNSRVKPLPMLSNPSRVVTCQLGFLDPDVTVQIQGQVNAVPGSQSHAAAAMVKNLIYAVEQGLCNPDYTFQSLCSDFQVLVQERLHNGYQDEGR